MKDVNFGSSQYPSNFIPKGAKIVVATDESAGEPNCTVKGFYDRVTGVFHLQEVCFLDTDDVTNASLETKFETRGE